MSRQFGDLGGLYYGFVVCPEEDASGFNADSSSGLARHRLCQDGQFLRLHHRLLGFLHIALVWCDGQMVAIAALS